MTVPNVDAIVRRVLAIAAGIDMMEITADTRVADLGIDSTYAMAMTTMLEMELDISIPLEDVIRFLSLETVGDFIGNVWAMLLPQ